MYVEFVAGGQQFITEIGNVREIVKRLPLTKVPGAGYAVLGIASLRDQVVRVIDGAAALGLESDPEWQYMLVTNSGTAFAVSDVREVLHIGSGIQESPVESELTEGVYLRGQDVLPVVNVEKIAGKF
jgi:chemotaxis signal transduction protein